MKLDIFIHFTGWWKWSLLLWNTVGADIMCSAYMLLSSDASQDRQWMHETAEDKLIIYHHYATDYYRGVTMQTPKSAFKQRKKGKDVYQDSPKIFLLYPLFIISYNYYNHLLL